MQTIYLAWSRAHLVSLEHLAILDQLDLPEGKDALEMK